MLTRCGSAWISRSAAPEDTPDPEIVAQAEGLAAVHGASLLITHDPAAAVGAPTPSTPTSGPAWDRSRKPSSAGAPSATTR